MIERELVGEFAEILTYVFPSPLLFGQAFRPSALPHWGVLVGVGAGVGQAARRGGLVETRHIPRQLREVVRVGGVVGVGSFFPQDRAPYLLDVSEARAKGVSLLGLLLLRVAGGGRRAARRHPRRLVASGGRGGGLLREEEVVGVGTAEGGRRGGVTQDHIR